MKQQEFLLSLEKALTEYRVQNVSDVLNDYREHFVHGLQNGKTEDEISEKLGPPNTIAKAYETEAMIAKVKSPETRFQLDTALRVIGRLIVLAPFNLIVLFIPGILVFSFLFAGWSVAAAIGSASLGLMAFGLKMGLFAFSFWASLALGSASLTLLGMGIFTGLLMFAMTKYVILGLIGYLQWNLKFVMEK